MHAGEQQWALPLIYAERIRVPAKTKIVATTDPSKPTITTSTVTSNRIGVTKQPDGSEWVWWSAKGSYLRAAVLVNGELPIVAVERRRKAREPQIRRCRRCNGPLPRTSTARKKYCDKKCQQEACNTRRANRRRAWLARAKVCEVEGCRRKGFCKKHYPHGHRERAIYWGVQYEPIVSTKVYDRDGWVCGLCSLPVNKRLKRPDPMSVSLDHVVPLSRGGDHLWDNVQCSHLLCNMRKHNRMP